ncbi:sugar transferase [Pseudobacteroides cellulosolvens ATCC 35603 = DSM 2933]|uniref:Sugar transferase n=3 Tax=Pseudobacteroides cellulosolvens TaxID=35825 RepID=A0A0L6JKK6_9FIRM|nr:sugar transferase [Pseudobacteroides cellulosolvens ATCC 35603 = DSM 2933]
MKTETKKGAVLSSKEGIYKKYIKRPMDFILAGIAIIILGPVLLTVAILVKIKLGSPVIFKQDRPGINEKIFKIYKFRTMTDERDENGELLPDSVRLTKFGKFLRSTSLDELPELWNIVRGDMAIVGPRPLATIYLPYYNDIERQRHDVRPGLTGLAQINGRNTMMWEERFAYDIQYINKITFWGDIKIIFKTMLKVFKQEGVSVRGTARVEDFHKHRMEQEKSTFLIDYSYTKGGNKMLLIDENIVLRAIEEKDANFLKDMINDPELENMVIGWSLPVSSKIQAEWINNLNSDDMKFIIEVNLIAVGMASISSFDFKNSVANLNIKIKSDEFRCRGIGTRTIRILINYCFDELNLNCLTANILEYNNPSQKVFEKCGFKKDGVLRSRIYKRGKYHNVLSYSLLRREYQKCER